MRTVTVDLGERSYSIHIGAGILGAGLLTDAVRGRQALVVTNETIAPLYLAGALETMRAAATRVGTLVLPDGEEHKTLASFERICGTLLEGRYDRDCVLVALGGGVVGDLTGFAAASYQRGVRYVQVPTTLLAQVDSSVGGKTAVNHPLGKNMIGAFHQPAAVIADTAVLGTLPARELAAGLAEVIKYGLIGDAAFFAWLEAGIERLRALDAAALEHAIEVSCLAKAAVVAADEREGGVRATLNFGHTFGHAIETGLGYGDWLHGEAVGAGMAMAAHLSAALGWLSDAEVARVEQLLARAGLPVRAPAALAPERLLDLMAVDKKVRGGHIRLVLLRAIGSACVTANYPPEALLATLAACRATAAA